jgi:glycosyltransferase involved in cell wall biosynthesis
MRILIVNYRYFISGGPEKYMFNVKKLLEDNGHEVIPFSVHSNKNVETEYSKFFVEPIGSRDNTYFDEVKKTPKTIWQMLTRSIYSVEVEKALRREIKAVKPDLVYIIHFVNKLSPSVIMGAKKEGVPVVLRLSDYFLLCPRFDFLYQKKICEDCLTCGYRSCIKKRCVKGSLFASVIRVFSMKVHSAMNIYKNVDAFITPSEFLKNKLVANGFDENKIHCIPTFTISKTEVDEPIIGSYGLYFGRITEEKGVETVVKAYEELLDHILKIVGDDTTDEAIRLKKYVNEHNMNNVEFVGFKSGIELENIIKEARFTLIPSIWYDNLPNTALESFQYSKPVIASNIGSLPELVTDGYNGYLFDVGDVKQLSDRIKRLDNSQLVAAMGANSCKRLESKFSPELHYAEIMSVFERVGSYRYVKDD